MSMPGGSIPKNSPQSHLTSRGLELGPQKSEERTKNTVPSRRIRTSMAEVRMDVRANGIARPSGPVNKDRDAIKLVNGGAALSEEKGRALTSGVDGRDNSKMRKKRSVIKSDVSTGAVLTRSLEADREPKRGIQQKLGIDARPMTNNVHGFRSRPASGASGVGKLDSASQQSGLGMRPLARNDQDNNSLPNDRRERLDKEGANLKVVNKPNNREDNFAANPTSLTKMNVPARGPRSNSGSMSKTSPSIHQMVGNSDDWEYSQSINKISSVGGAVNRKRTASMRSSSHPVQWVGQRPQKISRVARRSNFSPLVSNHDETPASDTGDNAGIHEDRLGLTRCLSSNASHQIKLKCDSVPTSGLSESEESGVADSKSRDKSKKCEIEENIGQSMQKITALALPPRKNKMAADEDIGDGAQRHGRVGRAFAPTRSGMAGPIEKLDNAVTVKQQRSTRAGSERIESKPGRPPTKKLSERKGYTRPRHSVNNAPLEFAGGSDDDHEEILAAANSALHTRRACSSHFWKEMEPFFGFLSSEDLTYLNQQIHCMDASSPNPYVDGNDDQDLKGDLEYISLPSTPAAAGRADCGAVSNGISFNAREREIELAWQTEHVEPLLEQLIQGIGAQSGVSICQALLSAIIEEEEIENINYNNITGEEYLHESHEIYFEVEGELKSKRSNFHSSRTLQTAARGSSNGFRDNGGWRYHDELTHEKLESGIVLLESSTVCTEFQYNQMGINDRILLELSEIGLYPDSVPDLAQSEDEDISDGVSRLEEKLHEQVMKKKNLLLKLEKAVMEARESQRRELECKALDRLVGMAYERYMAYWGPNAANSKNVNILKKRAALGFVKQTLARCKKFEETGNSCFSEPPFRDMFLSVSSCSSGAECTDISTDGEAAIRFTTVLQPQSTLADSNPNLTSKLVERVDTCDKYSDAFQSANHLSEQAFGEEEQWSNKIKRRELLLDDVIGSTSVASLRTSSGLRSSLVSGTKGKRSERDREGKGQNRDAASRNIISRIGRPALSNLRGERKNKAKPKQKTAQLSVSVNSLLSKAELPNATLPSDTKSRDMIVGGSTKKDDLVVFSSSARMQDMPNDAETTDLNNLQLPEIDVSDLGGHGQDIGSWLNIVDDDGLQDHDFMGLQIPMDDLSEVNMMI
ncbi:uncharacterized protein LOC103709271 isoform X1 [Phoenix dactylifera]|uniref:Uncharacterized protein LOC103709271 isoform X1 n=1 Tax=Phoenix dactylifera TaxID=42345 RepID=A0A8B7C6E9_PHODC|nr:uncharacterized protein LOC103709271 isoform X1 [Phoenix dactylifera]XP_008792771.2 uncharacterized protein LOC103709271 isoform X1 [Phoenix dactylifera]